MYLVAMVGNCGLLSLIRAESALSRSMYYFLSLLSLSALVGINTAVPKMMTTYCSRLREMEFRACLLQVFFIHTLTPIESGILPLTALDRFVAICRPCDTPPS